MKYLKVSDDQSWWRLLAVATRYYGVRLLYVTTVRLTDVNYLCHSWVMKWQFGLVVTVLLVTSAKLRCIEPG